MLSPILSGAPGRLRGGDIGTRAGSVPATPTAEVIERLSPAHRGLRFPDELLLSRDPQRFNTLLNQQITAVQRASDYLGETELALRQLARPLDSEKRVRQLQRARGWVARRALLSGGTIDRNFQPCLDRPARVIFQCPPLQALLFTEHREVITFALGEGTFRHWSSLVIEPEMPLTQRIFALNKALGQLHVWCHFELSEQRLLFTVPEDRWASLSHWAVRGSGFCFPADSLTLLQPQPLLSFEQQLQELLAGEPGAITLTAEQAVRHLQQERQKLHASRQQVDSQLAQRPALLDASKAQSLAEHLRVQFAGYRGEYRGLNQALACQANLPLALVCQLVDSR